MKEFLESKGYRMWKEDKDDVNGVTNFHNKKYQRRVDTDYDFDYPICQCNDKVFINVEYYDIRFYNDNHYVSYEMSLAHENKDGEWCDIKIHSLTEEQIKDSLSAYETKILNMWRVFYES